MYSTMTLFYENYFAGAENARDIDSLSRWAELQTERKFSYENYFACAEYAREVSLRK